jgi:hypothetical protein
MLMLHAVHGLASDARGTAGYTSPTAAWRPDEDDEPQTVRQPPRQTPLRQEEAEVRQRLSPFYGFREMLVSNVNGLNLVGNSAPKILIFSGGVADSYVDGRWLLRSDGARRNGQTACRWRSCHCVLRKMRWWGGGCWTREETRRRGLRCRCTPFRVRAPSDPLPLRCMTSRLCERFAVWSRE